MTAILFTIYRPDTGEISKTGFAAEGDLEAMLEALPDHDVLVGEQIDDALFMMPEGAVEPRPVLAEPEYSIAADGVAEVSFAIPAGTRVSARHLQQTLVSDGLPFSFASSVPGTYLFDLQPPFPHRQQTVRITIDAV